VSCELERRQAQRHLVHLVAEILVDDRQAQNAVSKDVSQNGLLLVTRARLEEQQPIALRVHLTAASARTVRVDGRVIRRQPLSPEETGMWREKVAVHFDCPQPGLAREFARLASEQASRYQWD
jgi:hypothetical protein